MLRYPIRMKTLSMKTGSSALPGLKLTFDGPFVSWTGKESSLPEASSFTPIEQWRAFDASGHRLEKHSYQGFSMSKGLTTKTYTYWGEVKEVRVDVVEEWAEIEIVYSLPSIDPLPATRTGTAPKTDKVKATPGGKVTMKVVVAAKSKPVATVVPKSVPVATVVPKKLPVALVATMSREDALIQLNKLGIRKFDASSFVMAATQGKSRCREVVSCWWYVRRDRIWRSVGVGVGGYDGSC
ncbi:hypothetical protein K8T06_18340 [bacterium]|nr:hypothetical protein [bacterium]